MSSISCQHNNVTQFLTGCLAAPLTQQALDEHRNVFPTITWQFPHIAQNNFGVSASFTLVNELTLQVLVELVDDSVLMGSPIYRTFWAIRYTGL